MNDIDQKIVGRTMNGKDTGESIDVIVTVETEEGEVVFNCSDNTYLVVGEKALKGLLKVK